MNKNFPSLPYSWHKTLVADACDNISVQKKIQQNQYKETGLLTIIDQGASFVGGYTDDLDKSITNELPVVIFGDHTRVIKYIDFLFAAGADGIKVLKPRDYFLPKLFYRFLQAIKLPEKGYSRHYQYLRTSYIALPPLNEQKRIADKLDSILARVEACRERLDRIPVILKRFRQAVLGAVAVRAFGLLRSTDARQA
jgi:type I restriction enzyme S subunit